MLVAVALKTRYVTVTPEDSLNELAQLAGTAGATIVGRMIQPLPVPTKAYYIGKGKLAELLALGESTNYDVVIFDDELSPLQQRNLCSCQQQHDGIRQDS